MDKRALNDLRLYVGYHDVPNEVLDEQGRMQLQDATARLLNASVQDVLELVVAINQSGLSPIKPGSASLGSARDAPPRRNDFLFNRFKK